MFVFVRLCLCVCVSFVDSVLVCIPEGHCVFVFLSETLYLCIFLRGIVCLCFFPRHRTVFLFKALCVFVSVLGTVLVCVCLRVTYCMCVGWCLFLTLSSIEITTSSIHLTQCGGSRQFHPIHHNDKAKFNTNIYQGGTIGNYLF